MEWLTFLVKGILIGFVASIPLGPVGMVCIQRTLCKSHRSGFLSGVAAATADTIFATIALFFLSVVLTFVQRHIDILKVLGGICVIIMGVNIFLKNPVVQIRRNRANKGSLWSDYLSVFLITLTNPAFILMFIALFATFGVSSEGDVPYFMGAGLIGGVFVGASFWWLALTSGVSLFRRRFRPRHMLYLNRISGALIVVLGAAAILSLFIHVSVDQMIH
jgi:threonine/homoserine/homoserine lactone efflux protein